MQSVETIGYVAATLVLTTFCMRSMFPLRVVAVASNLVFIAYGYLGELMPVLILHLLLLPMNLYRLGELIHWNNRADIPARGLRLLCGMITIPFVSAGRASCDDRRLRHTVRRGVQRKRSHRRCNG